MGRVFPRIFGRKSGRCWIRESVSLKRSPPFRLLPREQRDIAVQGRKFGLICLNELLRLADLIDHLIEGGGDDAETPEARQAVRAPLIEAFEEARPVLY